MCKFYEKSPTKPRINACENSVRDFPHRKIGRFIPEYLGKQFVSITKYESFICLRRNIVFSFLHASDLIFFATVSNTGKLKLLKLQESVHVLHIDINIV